jgi:hypothetical protein
MLSHCRGEQIASPAGWQAYIAIDKIS